MKEVVINAFNAATQQVEPHTVTADANGELIFRAADKTFFKLPAGLTQAGISKALDEHKNSNMGQISAAELEKRKEKSLGIVAALAALAEKQKDDATE